MTLQLGFWTTVRGILLALFALSVSSVRADYLISLRGPYQGGLSRILVLDDQGAYKGVFADPADGLNGPTGMDVGPDGKLYVANAASSQILSFDQVGTSSIFASTNLNGPSGIGFGPDGNLYAANMGSSSGTLDPFTGGTVVRSNGLTPDTMSVFIDYAPAQGVLPSAPTWVDFDNDSLYVSLFQWNEVRTYDYTAAGPVNETFLGFGGYGGPGGVAVEAGGDVFVSALLESKVYENLTDLGSLNLTWPGAIRLIGTKLFIMSAQDGKIVVYDTASQTFDDFTNVNDYLANFITPEEQFVLDLAGGILSIGDIVEFTPIPEPTTGALSIVGLLSLVTVARRNRRRLGSSASN